MERFELALTFRLFNYKTFAWACQHPLVPPLPALAQTLLTPLFFFCFLLFSCGLCLCSNPGLLLCFCFLALSCYADSHTAHTAVPAGSVWLSIKVFKSFGNRTSRAYGTAHQRHPLASASIFWRPLWQTTTAAPTSRNHFRFRSQSPGIQIESPGHLLWWPFQF